MVNVATYLFRFVLDLQQLRGHRYHTARSVFLFAHLNVKYGTVFSISATALTQITFCLQAK